jgi:hypothetical protein
MDRNGEARHGEARQARPGTARRGSARQGPVRTGRRGMNGATLLGTADRDVASK